MKQNFQKFMELVNSDEAIQKKLEEAVKNYTGEQTEQAAFENIVVPVAAEAGLPFTMEDFKQSVHELTPDEMNQVAGGRSIGTCHGMGVGWGMPDISEENGTEIGVDCFFIGIGGSLFGEEDESL